MPTIIMSDGKKLKVAYTKAAEAYQVLTCAKEPKNKEQAEFVSNIEKIIFDPIKSNKPVKRKNIERDEKLHELMADRKLKGYSKFVAIGQRLKENNKVA